MVSSVPAEIVKAIQPQTRSGITGFSFSSGGSINKGGRITSDGAIHYFLKWNDLKKFPGMFEREAKGLAMLSESKSLFVPKVLLAGDAGPYQFLLLEYIDEGPRRRNYWPDFGSGLAALHRTSAKHFGLEYDNYIGSLPQSNSQSSSWIEFFIERRLKFQLKLAIDAHNVERSLAGKFEILFSKLPSVLPEERPSLLHGDLWGGNVMVTAEGTPCLIDPAVYYGHREVDLAMTRLFGGFDFAFMDSYNEAYPLLQGYEDRFDLYNLYPLLVHVNLFGGGYVTQVLSILKKFV